MIHSTQKNDKTSLSTLVNTTAGNGTVEKNKQTLIWLNKTSFIWASNLFQVVFFLLVLLSFYVLVPDEGIKRASDFGYTVTVVVFLPDWIMATHLKPSLHHQSMRK